MWAVNILLLVPFFVNRFSMLLRNHTFFGPPSLLSQSEKFLPGVQGLPETRVDTTTNVKTSLIGLDVKWRADSQDSIHSNLHPQNVTAAREFAMHTASCRWNMPTETEQWRGIGGKEPNNLSGSKFMCKCDSEFTL